MSGKTAEGTEGPFEKHRRKMISGEPPPKKRVKMTFGGKAQQTSSRISGKELTALCRP
jgi:hypothetical protein